MITNPCSLCGMCYNTPYHTCTTGTVTGPPELNLYPSLIFIPSKYLLDGQRIQGDGNTWFVSVAECNRIKGYTREA